MNTCRNGHPMTGDNVQMRSDGKRRCRTCDLQRRRHKHAERITAVKHYRGLAHAVRVSLSALEGGNPRLALTVLSDAARSMRATR